MRRSLGLLAVAVLSVGASMAVPTSAGVADAAATASGCPSWHSKTIVTGLGTLESLLPDNHGGMLLSSTKNNAIERLTPNGKVHKVASAASPGELVWRGKQVLFPTGDDFADGAAYVTRDLGTGTGITRIAAKAPHAITKNWSKVGDTNGIAINRRTHTMYVDQTFTTGGPVVAISMRHPSRSHKVADLGGLGTGPIKGLDDLTMSKSGVLYLPGNVSGQVFSYDPKTGQKCLIAHGLGNPSDVTIGTGHGWRKGAVFVCGFDGSVREYWR